MITQKTHENLMELLQRRPTRPPPPLTRIRHNPPPLTEIQSPSPEPAQMTPCPLAQALLSPPAQPQMRQSSQELLSGWHEVRRSPYPDVKARTQSFLAWQRGRTKTLSEVTRLKLPEKATPMADEGQTLLIPTTVNLTGDSRESPDATESSRESIRDYHNPNPDVKARIHSYLERQRARTKTHSGLIRLKRPVKATPMADEGQTVLIPTTVNPTEDSRGSPDSTESSREPIREYYNPSHEELSLLEEFEECMEQDVGETNTQAGEVVKDTRSSTKIVSADEQMGGSGCDYNRYPITRTESLSDSRTDEVLSVPMKPPPPPSPSTKYLVSVGYLTPPPTPPTPPEESTFKYITQIMRTKDFSPLKPKYINSYDTEALPVHNADVHYLGEPTVSSTVEPTQSTAKVESPGVSIKDPFQKPRMFSRKGKYLAPLFKKAPEGFPAVPNDCEAECFLCNRSASGNRVYEHMFFGSLECADCALILRTCEDFKVMKNRKGECRNSKGTHRFTQWADCPVEYLSYCVSESLAKRESGHDPLSTSDVARELGKYLRKLSLLRCFKPWKTAYSQCKEFVNANTTPSQEDLERRLQNTTESNNVLSSSEVTTHVRDTEIESSRKDNSKSPTPLPENTLTSQLSDTNPNENCADIELESTPEDNNRPSTPLVEKETVEPKAIGRTERLECCLPEEHSIDHLDSIVTYMAVDDNGETHVLNNQPDDRKTEESPDEETELASSSESHESSSRTKANQNTAFETPRKASFSDSEDSNYVVYEYPNQNSLEECPMCYCVLCPSMFTVNVVTFVVSAKCPDCALRIHVVFGSKEGSVGKKRHRKKE